MVKATIWGSRGSVPSCIHNIMYKSMRLREIADQRSLYIQDLKQATANLALKIFDPKNKELFKRFRITKGKNKGLIDIESALIDLLTKIDPSEINVPQYLKDPVGDLDVVHTYGGDTTCIAFETKNKKHFCIDAGTGIVKWGNYLMKNFPQYNQGRGKIDIFLTHYHHDHTQGIPFFVPFLIGQKQQKPVGTHESVFESNHIIFHGIEDNVLNPLDMIKEIFLGPKFPVGFENFEKRKEGKMMNTGDSVTIDEVVVTAIQFPTQFHMPWGVIGYNIHNTETGKDFVVITDYEPQIPKKEGKIVFEDFSEVKVFNKLIGEKDHVLMDSQYDLGSFLKKLTWGHSPWEYSVEQGIKNNVKNILLTHHSPFHTDDHLNERQNQATNLFNNLKDKYANSETETVRLAYDTLEVDF